MVGGSMQERMSTTAFQPDPQQLQVLDHRRGPLLVTGAPGTGKTVVLQEPFARLIESGADPERVTLVVRSRAARGAARRRLLARLSRPLPGMRVVTVQGLAHHAISLRFRALGYHRPPTLLPALDQFSRVQELLAGEDRSDWPAFSPRSKRRAGMSPQLMPRAGPCMNDSPPWVCRWSVEVGG